MKKYWKRLFLKYFDFNENKDIDWWEITIVIGIIFIFQLIIEIIANIITK